MRPSKSGTQPKVGEFDVSFLIDENVVWFDVTMNETEAMHVLNGARQFRYVES